MILIIFQYNIQVAKSRLTAVTMEMEKMREKYKSCLYKKTYFRLVWKINFKSYDIKTLHSFRNVSNMQLNYILYFRSYLDKLKQICTYQEETIQQEVIYFCIHSFIHSFNI